MPAYTNKTWIPLQAGDVVDIVAPASASTPQELRQGVAYLKSLGLVPRVPKDLYDKRFVFSNSDQYRLKHLLKSLLSPDSKAVWAIRGGYGSMRLLPMLAKARAPKQTKLLLGLSDITSLHIFLNQEWNWPTVHGPVLARMGGDHPKRLERSEVERVLFGRVDELSYRLTPKNKYARSHGRIRSSLTGGNLEVIAGQQGTPWQIEARSKILFIEEVNERGYRVDRKFQNFKLSGVFDEASAVVFGEFVGGTEPDTGRKMWKDAIDELAATVKIPVYTGLRSGHGHVQRPVPFNTEARLEGRVLTVKTGAKIRP